MEGRRRKERKRGGEGGKMEEREGKGKVTKEVKVKQKK